MLRKSEMDNLKKIARGIATQFGSDCEVVIHTLGDQSAETSVAAIENGHVSGRKIGDGPSQVVLEQLAAGDTKEDHLSYLTKTPDGKILKSSTIYLRDSQWRGWGPSWASILIFPASALFRTPLRS